MKRLCIILVGVMFFVAGCDTDSMEISSENIFESVLPDDGMIKEAEKTLGILYKEEKVFIDPSSGSEFRMIFAAQDKFTLLNFFADNSVIIRGIQNDLKQQLLKGTISSQVGKTPDVNKSSQTMPDGFIESDVYYDLSSKILKGKDVGFSFSIIPLKVKNPDLKSARPAGLNWRQQTSLPWCEVAALDMIIEQPAQGYIGYTQNRVFGFAWTNGMPINGPLITDGSRYLFNIDDKKYYRFGGYDPTIYKFNVTWYDFESGNSITN